MSDETIERPTKGVRYDINPTADGHAVLRVPKEGDILTICSVKDGTITYVSDTAAKYDPVVKRRLNEHNIPYSKTVVLGNPALVATNDASATYGDPVAIPAPRPFVPPVESMDITVDQRKAVNHLRYQAGLPQEVEKPAPPMPRKGKCGDKTKEIVEWYLRYDPEGFIRKYGVEGVGTVPATRTEIISGKQTITKFMREGVISRRKTHLTLINDETRRARNNA